MTITCKNVLSLLKTDEGTTEESIAVTAMRGHESCVEPRHSGRVYRLLRSLKKRGQAYNSEKGWFKAK